MSAMNYDRAALEEYLQSTSSHYRSAQPRPQPSSGVASVLTIIAFTVFACLTWPLLSDAATGPNAGRLQRYLYALQEMASRLSLGLVRRPLLPATAHDGGSALNSVFGLKTGAGASLKTLGADTLQRGIGGIRSIMVKGSGGAGAGASDAPAGLGNWDNSCYQNSVIQGLASLRALPGFLGRVARASPGGESMNEALLEMVWKLNDAGNNGRQLWLPPALKTMSTWQQQDAQEYFSKVLEKVDKEAVRVAMQEIATRRELGLGEAKVEMDAGKGERTLHNPLEGLIAQRVGCKSCGHSDGISLIPFNCLTVPLGHNSLYDIRDCLDEYTKLEEIDGVQCPKCTLLQFRSKLEDMVAKASSDALRQHVEQRLQAVLDALRDDDFSDNAITKRCQIPKKQWVESTKTKQAVVARAPQGLIMHVNRSMFNEYTGAQIKNPAAVQFPLTFGLGHWMLGSKSDSPDAEEKWSMEPQKSMLPEPTAMSDGLASNARYELRAVVTHFGRHENGHYVCYRKHPCTVVTADEDGEMKIDSEAWWRLSDDDVHRVGEDLVLRQGGVFMLFYERLDEEEELRGHSAPAETVEASVAAVVAEEAAQVPLPDDGDDIDDILASDSGEKEVIVSEAQPGPELTPARSGKPDSTPTQLPTPPESVSGSEDLDSVTTADDEPVSTGYNNAPGPAQAIRMRTANVFVDDKNKGSTESLLMGTRMVSA